MDAARTMLEAAAVVIPHTDADGLAAGAIALRARGEFRIKRSDFKVPATSAFHGTVRVRDTLKVSFDIVATKAAFT